MKAIKEEAIAFDIDYDLFTTEEIVKIFNFFSLMMKNAKYPQKNNIIIEAYLVYKNTINNLSLEKKYNEMFFKQTGISIYQVINNIKKTSN